MSDIFISYARGDRETAQALAAALGRHGWSVWWDRNIPPGYTFDEVIESQLAEARCVIVLWSKTSVASEWVKSEASDAKERHLLVPVLIEQVKIPLEFRRVQTADLTGWKGEPSHRGLSKLISDLTVRLGTPAEVFAGDESATDDAQGTGGVAPPEVAPDPDEPPESNTEGDDVTGNGKRAGTGAETERPPVGVEEPPSRRLLVVVGLAVLAVALAGLGLALVKSRDPLSVPERLKRVEGLINQLANSNSITQKERTDAYRILTTEYVSDPRVIERLLARLDESRVGVVLQDEVWLKNILYVLSDPNSTDAAWTADSVRKADAAVAVLDKTQLTQPPTKDALGQFKRRVAALKKAKVQQ